MFWWLRLIIMLLCERFYLPRSIIICVYFIFFLLLFLFFVLVNIINCKVYSRLFQYNKYLIIIIKLYLPFFK